MCCRLLVSHSGPLLSLLCSFSPSAMCAKVQVQSLKGNRKPRAVLCTRNNLQNVCLHPSCVSCKDFRRIAAHKEAWTLDGRVNFNDGSTGDGGFVQYLVFFESMRSSEIFLRNVHWVQPLLLA